MLCVEDDRLSALLFEEAARVAGCEAEVAEDAAEALALAARWRPDLLVIDLHLPDARGTDLLARLRDEAGVQAEAWLCSADDDDATREAAIAAGFRGCWPKPVSPALLEAERIRRAGPAPAGDSRPPQESDR